jgi:hypothetical protein
MKIPVMKDDNVIVLCPHCAKELKELIERPVQGGLITNKSVYACGNCRKAIPVSSRTYAF